MKIEKGIVKYKDRSDIVCTYGTTDDGTKYYFLDENDEKKFTNGNRIVSSLLVEAIDPMAKASNIGVIDENGVIVIPCVNRSIRTVDDNTILVEAAVPISQSVIDAVELRNDPLAATKLVSTPATIKDNINEKMGVEGKYLFNDQFSEATVCDINGNNLVDNEYYSFIAQANGKLYMSKNVAESDVKELVLGMDSLDLGSVSVSQDVVEDALTSNTGDVLDSMIPAEAFASSEGSITPTDELGTGEEEIIPYNDDLSTVVEDGTTENKDNGLESDAGLDIANDSSVELTDEDTMLHDSAPDFLTAEDMLSATSDIPPVVEDNNDSLGVNIGAEAGFDVMPTDMDVVAPYNEDLTTAVNDTVAEVSQDSEVVLATEVAPEENVNNEQVEAVEASSELASEIPIVDIPMANDETVVTEEVVSDEVENKDSNVTALDAIASLGGNDNKNEDVVAIPEVTEEVSENNENNVLDVISSINSPAAMPEKLSDDVVADQPLTIDADTVASIVDKDGNGINDSIDSGFENGGIVDIFKEAGISGRDDIMSPSNTNLNANLDFLGNNYTAPLNGFDRNPVESFGSHEYTVPSNGQYNSLFTDTQTDKLPYGDDNIMSDVVRSMSDLMRQNKEQRNTIVQYQERLDAVEAQRRMAIEQYKQTAIRVEALSSKLRSLEESSTRLEARNQMYETRLRDQEKIISSQERELKTLRPQLEGKQDLVKLLADAKALLGNDTDYSSYDDGSNYYRRVA